MSSLPDSISKIFTTALWYATATFLRSVLIASTAVAPGVSGLSCTSSGYSTPYQPHVSFNEPPPDGPLTSHTLTEPSAPQLISVPSSLTRARSQTASVWPTRYPRDRVSSYGAYVVC